MAEKKTASIPAWQRASTENEPPVPSANDGTKSSGEESAAQQPREALLKQARQFLEDPSISQASTEKKTSFLETKGLQQDEIQELLSTPPPKDKQIASPSSTASPELKTIHDSSNEVQNTSLERAPSSSGSSTTSTSSPPSNQPPIITYPEFLLQAQKPPPIITFQRLLYTLYLCAGLGATFYGTSKYLITPLLASLTASRHSFFGATQTNLQTLNDKLSSSVSRVPDLPSTKPTSSSSHQAQADEDDTSSLASDPTELFHRDIATQTTPSIPQSPISGAQTNLPSSLSTTQPPKTTTATDTQTSSLTTLTTHLHTLLTSESSSSSSSSSSSPTFPSEENPFLPNPPHSLSTTLSALKTYLDTLKYGGGGGGTTYDRSYSNSYDYGDYNNSNNKSRGGLVGTEDDEVARFKAEIRSVKGALLSARNFPSAPGR
ncbi:MAG: hypothetical protein Q9160_003354 [Pyrenula sp. 1 TL-2023]